MLEGISKKISTFVEPLEKNISAYNITDKYSFGAIAAATSLIGAGVGAIHGWNETESGKTKDKVINSINYSSAYALGVGAALYGGKRLIQEMKMGENGRRNFHNTKDKVSRYLGSEDNFDWKLDKRDAIAYGGTALGIAGGIGTASVVSDDKKTYGAIVGGSLGGLGATSYILRNQIMNERSSYAKNILGGALTFAAAGYMASKVEAPDDGGKYAIAGTVLGGLGGIAFKKSIQKDLMIDTQIISGVGLKLGAVAGLGYGFTGDKEGFDTKRAVAGSLVGGKLGGLGTLTYLRHAKPGAGISNKYIGGFN